MSQPTTERPPREDGGGLSQKLGPLPAWAWIGVAAVGGIIVILWLRSRNATAAQPAANSVSPDTATVGNLQDQLAVIASQIRDVQGGTSTPVSGTQPTRTAIVVGGQHLKDFLAQYNVSLQDFLNLNPDLAQYLKTTNANGFGPGGPDSLAFDFGPNVNVKVVQLPLVTTPKPPPFPPIATTTNGHAVTG